MKVFVYGTLKKGHGNHYILDKDPIETIIADLPFYMVSLGAFPALVPTRNDQQNQIVGEVYDISRQELSRLDHLEGYPNFYDRMPMDMTDYGIGEEVWVYYIPEIDLYDHWSKMESGDWSK